MLTSISAPAASCLLPVGGASTYACSIAPKLQMGNVITAPSLSTDRVGGVPRRDPSVSLWPD